MDGAVKNVKSKIGNERMAGSQLNQWMGLNWPIACNNDLTEPLRLTITEGMGIDNVVELDG